MKLLPINTQKEDSTPNNVKQIPNIYLLTTSSVLIVVDNVTLEEIMVFYIKGNIYRE